MRVDVVLGAAYVVLTTVEITESDLRYLIIIIILNLIPRIRGEG